MAEMLEDSGSLESTTVGIYRTAATVKGGRRFSFGALVVVGDRNGSVGLGYGKANQVPPAIEKAQKEAKRKMRRFPMEATTIPHAVTGRFGSCSVRLMPASPGTGVIAGASVRAPLEMAGVQDCLTKVYGSTNPRNLVKAVIDGLEQLRAKADIEALRGVTLDPTDVQLAIERGRAHAPAVAPSTTETAEESGDKPQGRDQGRDQGRGGKGGGRGERGGRGDKGRGGRGGRGKDEGPGLKRGARTDVKPQPKPAPEPAAEAPPAEAAPAAEAAPEAPAADAPEKTESND